MGLLQAIAPTGFSGWQPSSTREVLALIADNLQHLMVNLLVALFKLFNPRLWGQVAEIRDHTNLEG